MTSQGSAAPAITADELAGVSGTRVFFGHQSVGMNVLDAVPGVYASHGLAAPAITLDRPPPGRDGGFIAHAFIGANEQPWPKIADFDARMRAGVGERVDVALMKLCYIDITSGTDTEALFARYRETLADLARDFPRVTFVHLTVPLTTEPGRLARLKGRLGGGARFGPAENAARERLNTAIRREYAGGHLVDLAAIESTAPDGHRAGGTFGQQRYYALYPGYAADPGHLNGEGAQLAATGWLRAIAQARAK